MKTGDEGLRLIRKMRKSASSNTMKMLLTILTRTLLLLIVIDCCWALTPRQTECAFPVRWEGTWFQSGVRQPILISKNILSSKGRCLRNEGDKFLVVDEKSCYRCVVIHEKHSNVLQYKETYCHNRNSLPSLCSYITGDALLYSMFREEATAVSCPFRGPMTFTYNRGHGTCSSPLSNVDTCTDDSRLLFKYQACPDVPASESAVEELECLATWKEGSSRYLVGRLHHGHASSNEERYRCFVYERAGQSVGAMTRAVLGMATIDHESGLPSTIPLTEDTPEVYRVAQSGDATCNGLFSPMEGSRTMTLTKALSPGKCRFPSWLSGHTNNGLTWHTLDLTRSYTFYPRNASLHVTRSNSSTRLDNSGVDFQDIIDGQDEQTIMILCNSIKQTNPSQTITMLVAHFTVGCQSGFICMTFYRRDGHVIEMQTGSPVSRSEEACSSPHHQPRNVPYLTLVTSSPEPRQCPYLGKFAVTEVNRNQKMNDNNKKSNESPDETHLRHSDDRKSRKYDFDIDQRRVNNDYKIHEHLNRRSRTKRSSEFDDVSKKINLKTIKKNKIAKKNIENFNINISEFSGSGEFWDFEDRAAETSHDDYFGDYEVNEKPEKRSNLLSYNDLLRIKRSLNDDSYNYDDNYNEKREKREEEESKCSAEVTTLNVGCSTADKMEFQSDCIDDSDAVTAYSCHGRWFDTEGNQYVIATPIARKSSWSNGNNEPQAFRNTRRLCFMYRESGGVVSLTASTTACQRGVQTQPPLLAFNATSIGQCMEDNGSSSINSSYIIIISIVILCLEVLR